MSTSTKLEQFKSLLENINLDIKDNVLASIREIRQLIENWCINLPNLREVCRSEQIDRLIAAVLMYIKEENYKTGKQVINFVVRTGYKDSHRPLLNTTPLHRAFRYNYYVAHSVGAQLFAIYNRYDVNYTDEFGLSHFHVACAFGFEDVVLKFLEFGRIVPDRIVTKARESPLYLALRYNRKNIVKVLLRADSDPNILLNDEQRTVLHVISQKHYDYGTRTAMIIELSKEVKRPVLIDARDKSGNTPLHLSIARCASTGTIKETAVEVLLDKGADPNLANSQGWTPLHFICHHGRRSVGLAKLLMNKSTVEHLPLRIDTEDHQGNTPLHLALESKRFSLAEFLLDKGANPNLTNVKNETALHLISRRRVNDRTLKILFDRPEELRIDIQDKEGNTPVHLALMRYGNKKAAEYLLSRRPNPTLDNAEGLTPLHICLKNGHEASAKFFSQMVDQLDLSGRAQFQRALACLLAPGELDVLLDRGVDEKLIKKRNNQSLISKFRLVTGVLILVLSYEEREEKEGERKHQLEPSDALIIMKLFEQYKLLQKPAKQAEKRWYDDEEFTSKAKSIKIVPNLSLNDLVRMRPERQMKRITYRDYLEFAHSKRLNELQAKHRNPCILQLCETMARGFFRRLALYRFWLMRKRSVPLEVCEMIVKHLDNQSLYNTCLAATGQSSLQGDKDDLQTNLKRKRSNKEPPKAKKAKN